MHIRLATPDDADAISRLIKGLARHFTIHPDGIGAEGFLQGLEPDGLRQHITAANFRYYAGLEEDALVGVIALRDGAHLYHLFVAEAAHGRGYGRQLWEHARAAALADAKPPRFTVNSSVSAMPVYQRFGFVATGPRVETRGVAFVPMELPIG